MRVVFLVSLLFAGLSPELTAQGASLQFSPPPSSLLFLAEPRKADLAASTAGLDELRPALGRRADYRWEFGIAGAALLGIAGAVSANAACNPDTTSGSCVGPVVGTGAVGALVGGVAGLFIGAGIDKRTD